MATLKILSQFTMSTQGKTVAGKQGAAADTAATTLDLSTTPTVDGITYEMVGQIATATVRTLWDEDSNFPVDFDYGFFWADQKVYLQFVGSAGRFVIPVRATVPYWIPGFDEFLADATTTLITGGTEPTMENMDSIIVGNYSGATANFCLYLIE